MHALLAGAPALPLGEAGKYVAAAYIVFLLLIVVYVAIMAAKVQRIERELRDLAAFAESQAQPDPGQTQAAPGQTQGAPGQTQGAPGRGSEGQSISVSSAPSESGGGAV